MRSIYIDHSITASYENSLHRYLAELDCKTLLSVDEEILLAQKIKQGDKVALDRLVKSNLRFVVSCAKKYQHLGMPLSDLINEGNFGLIKAAKLFDETKGFKFISYAVWWIRQAMLSALGNDAHIIRLPGNMMRATADIRKAADLLEQRLERRPTSGEIQEQVYVPNESMAMVYAFDRTVLSLDESASADRQGELVWGQVVADAQALDADHELMEQSAALELERMLGVLGERDRLIVSEFFGLHGESKNLEDIGLSLGLTSERVRQLKLRAIQRIRKTVNQSIGVKE